jgi:hypothetical protein
MEHYWFYGNKKVDKGIQWQLCANKFDNLDELNGQIPKKLQAINTG